MKGENIQSYVSKRYHESRRLYEELLESDSSTSPEITEALIKMLENKGAVDELVRGGFYTGSNVNYLFPSKPF